MSHVKHTWRDRKDELVYFESALGWNMGYLKHGSCLRQLKALI